MSSSCLRPRPSAPRGPKRLVHSRCSAFPRGEPSPSWSLPFPSPLVVPKVWPPNPKHRSIEGESVRAAQSQAHPRPPEPDPVGRASGARTGLLADDSDAALGRRRPGLWRSTAERYFRTAFPAYSQAKLTSCSGIITAIPPPAPPAGAFSATPRRWVRPGGNAEDAITSLLGARLVKEVRTSSL